MQTARTVPYSRGCAAASLAIAVRVAGLADNAGELPFGHLGPAPQNADLHAVPKIDSVSKVGRLAALHGALPENGSEGLITAGRVLRRLAVTGDCPAPR